LPSITPVVPDDAGGFRFRGSDENGWRPPSSSHVLLCENAFRT
jgi:hypothetical protein